GVFMSKTPVTQASKQYLRFEMSADSIHREAILVWFDDKAKTNFEPTSDGLYMLGDNTVSLSSLSSDHIRLSIDKQPFPKAERRVIALNASATESGAYHFNMKQIVGIPGLYDVWLHDEYKKDSVNLRKTSKVDFSIDKKDSSSFGNKRFNLIISQNPDSAYRLL